MPLKIINDYSNPNYSRRVVYTPDPADLLRSGSRARPRGSFCFDVETGRYAVLPKPPAPTQFLGLDLGQAADYTALALVVPQANGCAVPMLDRVRGLPYPQLVSRVADLLETPQLAGKTLLAVDATGVGRPVLDLLRSAGLSPIAVTIHGGAKVTGGGARPMYPSVTSSTACLWLCRQVPYTSPINSRMPPRSREKWQKCAGKCHQVAMINMAFGATASTTISF